MNVNVLAPLLVGFAFGWILQKAGLSRYDRIVNVFRFRDLAVLKFLLTALVTAAVGIRVVEGLGVGPAPPVPMTYAWGNLAGGILFGVGMATSGFCPGTVAAGVGEGRLDYLVPGMLGLYTGALVFGALYERIMPLLAGLAPAGAITLADWLHVDPWLCVILFGEVVLVVFYFLEHGVRRAGRGAAGGARPAEMTGGSAETTGRSAG